MNSYLREIPTELGRLRMSSSMRHDRFYPCGQPGVIPVLLSMIFTVIL